jgi:hypothetical protein
VPDKGYLTVTHCNVPGESIPLTLEEVQAALPKWCVWKEWGRWVASHPAGLKLDAPDGKTLLNDCRALEGESPPS